MNLKWWFPESGGRGEGFNQGGMSQFTDNHLYREMVQNSLDARRGNDTVLIELAEIDLDTSWIDGTGLAETIGRCSESKYVTTEQDRRLLDDARRLLTDGTVRALSVTDLGTTGTQDEPESDGGLSPWEGLTDSEGSPVAKNERSGGSFGLGKYAPLAATPLRTVLYSTRYQDAAGGTHTRFRGRAVLVTHEGPDGHQKSADGYLGDGTGKRSLHGEAIPSRFRMHQVGTQILIPGWEPSGGDSWRVQAVCSIVESYFYAVLEERLGAVLYGDSGDERASVVSSETIRPGGDVYKLLQEQGDKETKTTARYVLVAAKPPVAKTHIPGIGKVVLHIDVGPDNGRRDLALVRWPGLKVTDRAGQLGEANPRIPYGWERFTAVVATEPVGDGDDDWVLRACENPRHDGLSVNQIPKSQPGRRRTARSALRELRKWVYQEIRSRAQGVGDSAADDAHELLDFGLSVKRDGAGSAGVRLLRTKQVRRRPPATTVPSADVPSLPSDVDDETSEELSEGQHERQDRPGPKPGPGPRPGPGPGPRPVTVKQVPRIDLEPVFVGHPERPEQVRLSVLTPGAGGVPAETIHVAVNTVGEDGREHTVGLMSAYGYGKQLRLATVGRRKGFLLPPGQPEQERTNLRVCANVPLAGRSFRLVAVQANIADQPSVG